MTQTTVDFIYAKCHPCRVSDFGKSPLHQGLKPSAKGLFNLLQR
jgi:hypothetical protein